MSSPTVWSLATYAPPPRVGEEYLGPPVGGNVRHPGLYTVVAIVDLGFFTNEPTYFQVVFRYWSKTRDQWAWTVVGAEAIDDGTYKPVPLLMKMKRKR